MIMRLISRIPPRTLLGVATSFVSMISQFIITVGLPRTIRVLFAIRTAIVNNSTFNSIKKFLISLIGSAYAEQFLSFLESHWSTIINNNNIFKSIMNRSIFVCSLIALFKPLYTFSIRTFFIFFFGIFLLYAKCK